MSGTNCPSREELFGYLVGALGYWLGGYEHPLLWIGAVTGYVIGPVWAFRLARALLADIASGRVMW